MKLLSNVRFTEPIFYLRKSFLLKNGRKKLITAATTATSAVKSWVFLIQLKVLFNHGKRLCGAH